MCLNFSNRRGLAKTEVNQNIQKKCTLSHISLVKKSRPCIQKSVSYSMDIMMQLILDIAHTHKRPTGIPQKSLKKKTQQRKILLSLYENTLSCLKKSQIA